MYFKGIKQIWGTINFLSRKNNTMGVNGAPDLFAFRIEPMTLALRIQLQEHFVYGFLTHFY